MATAIRDQSLANELIAERKRLGHDRYDEVWEGVYMMSPALHDDHALMLMRLSNIFDEKIGLTGKGDVRIPVNISDRVINWRQNYRVPDLAVMLKGGQSVNHGTFWHGGPDFVVEVCSPDEDPHEKVPFYESIGVREFLVIDRAPWRIELFRLENGSLSMASDCTPGHGEVISEVLPFAFSLREGAERPDLVVRDTENETVRVI